MIGKLLGHSQVETTARYAHLARDSVQEAAEPVSPTVSRPTFWAKAGGRLPVHDLCHTYAVLENFHALKYRLSICFSMLFPCSLQLA